MTISQIKGRFISDEAHHLNVDTKTLAKNKDEQDNYKSWEYTVRRIFEMNKDNVLLEFTATCDIHNPQIRAEYESKIVYDYPLSKFKSRRLLQRNQDSALRCVSYGTGDSSDNAESVPFKKCFKTIACL